MYVLLQPHWFMITLLANPGCRDFVEELYTNNKKNPGSGVTCTRLVGMFLLLLLSTSEVSEGIRLIDYFLDSGKWSHTDYWKDP